MLYTLVGNGEGNKTAVMASLHSLASNVEDGDEFWMMVEVEEKPSDTVTAIMNWVNETGIYYEVVEGSTQEGMNPLYGGAEVTWPAKRPFDRLLKLTATRVDPNGEKNTILILEDNLDDSEDILYVITKALDNHIPVKDLGNQLIEFTIDEPEEQPSPSAVSGTGAERYLDARLADPEYADAYMDAKPHEPVDVIDKVNNAIDAANRVLEALDEDDGPTNLGEYFQDALEQATLDVSDPEDAPLTEDDIKTLDESVGIDPRSQEAYDALVAEHGAGVPAPELAPLRSADLYNLSLKELKSVVDQYDVRDFVNDMRNKSNMIEALMLRHGVEDDLYFAQEQQSITEEIAEALEPVVEHVSDEEWGVITADGPQPEVEGVYQHFLVVITPDGTLKVQALSDEQARLALEAPVF